jgi:hypothetical protein
MDDATASTTAPVPSGPTPNLSYKYERLRERLRAAVKSGELAGRLPGERALARKFRANPKTLSKALTDLAADGVLQRRVGQGTFVAGDAPADTAPWLVLTPGDEPGAVGEALLRLLPRARHCDGQSPLRPSHMVRIGGVINLCPQVPAALVHDLQVRGIPLVDGCGIGGDYALHAVLFDRARAAFELTRRLLLAGHQHIAVTELPGGQTLQDAAALAATQFNSSAVVQACPESAAVNIAMEGATAWLCHSTGAARAVHSELAQGATLLLRDDFSITAIDEIVPSDAAFTGVYLDPLAHAREIASLIPMLQPHRRSILCLAGQFADLKTLRGRPQHNRPVPRWQMAGIG